MHTVADVAILNLSESDIPPCMSTGIGDGWSEF